jgi:hypothetical protein
MKVELKIMFNSAKMTFNMFKAIQRMLRRRLKLTGKISIFNMFKGTKNN